MKTDIPQDKFLDLVNLVLTTTWYKSNSQFYQQTDGVALGGPASSTTEEIYMQAPEQTPISTAVHSPLIKFIPLLNVRTWKTFSITSTIFIKTLSLLWRKNVMEN